MTFPAKRQSFMQNCYTKILSKTKRVVFTARFALNNITFYTSKKTSKRRTTMNYTKDELTLIYQYATPVKQETIDELEIIKPHIKHMQMQLIIESTIEKLSTLTEEQFSVLACNTKAYFIAERDQNISSRKQRMEGKRPKKIVGHDLMDLSRFTAEVKHMIIFDVLNDSAPVGFRGERVRIYLNPEGYKKALKSQAREEIKIITHARVVKGNLIYDTPSIDR